MSNLTYAEKIEILKIANSIANATNQKTNYVEFVEQAYKKMIALLDINSTPIEMSIMLDGKDIMKSLVKAVNEEPCHCGLDVSGN